MLRMCVCTATLLVLSISVLAETATFTLLTHGDNTGRLPQSKGIPGQSGDHLLGTGDDTITNTWNPSGCSSFNFMNPYGEWPSDYPEGYVEGIHSMEGIIEMEIDLSTGGAVTLSSLNLHGQAKPTPTGDTQAYQYLVNPGDPATGGGYGAIDGIGNSGSYAASADSNWAFTASVDMAYDTPCAGAGNIDLTFNDFQWEGFIIPVSELNATGMDAVTLTDPLGLFPGTSEEFESWLLNEVADRLPPTARHLLFIQGEAKSTWNNPAMQSWDPDYGVFGETLIAYTIPEPTSIALLLTGLFALTRRGKGAGKQDQSEL